MHHDNESLSPSRSTNQLERPHQIGSRDGDKSPVQPIHQAQLRLAVSSTYYAIYHALARSNADTLVGASEADHNHPGWTRTYVALGGDVAVERVQGNFTDYSQEIRDLVKTFVVVNEQRLFAEEDPVITHTPEEALAWIERAEAAISALLFTDVEGRRELAQHLLADRQKYGRLRTA